MVFFVPVLVDLVAFFAAAALLVDFLTGALAFGAAFLGAAVAFLGAPVAFLSTALALETAAFLKSALNLYEFFTLTKSPVATPFFNASRNVAFFHFLSDGNLSCIYFLIEIIEDPVRSLSSVIASTIPALYDMI